MMLDGGNLFMHLVTPLVALLTLTLFENEPQFKFKYSLLGVVPTLVYGTVYVICVFAIKCWIDFYRFNLNGYWYLILPGMILLSTIISIATNFLRKLTSNKKV